MSQIHNEDELNFDEPLSSLQGGVSDAAQRMEDSLPTAVENRSVEALVGLEEDGGSENLNLEVEPELDARSPEEDLDPAGVVTRRTLADLPASRIAIVAGALGAVFFGAGGVWYVLSSRPLGESTPVIAGDETVEGESEAVFREPDGAMKVEVALARQHDELEALGQTRQEEEPGGDRENRQIRPDAEGKEDADGKGDNESDDAPPPPPTRSSPSPRVRSNSPPTVQASDPPPPARTTPPRSPLPPPPPTSASVTQSIPPPEPESFDPYERWAILAGLGSYKPSVSDSRSQQIPSSSTAMGERVSDRTRLASVPISGLEPPRLGTPSQQIPSASIAMGEELSDRTRLASVPISGLEPPRLGTPSQQIPSSSTAMSEGFPEETRFNSIPISGLEPPRLGTPSQQIPSASTVMGEGSSIPSPEIARTYNYNLEAENRILSDEPPPSLTTIATGERVRAQLETPVAWVEGEDLELPTFLAVLEEAILDARGDVAIPTGARLLLVQTSNAPALVRLEAIAIAFDGREVPLPQGAFSILAEGGEPLVAEALGEGNATGELLLGALFGGLSRVGEELTRPERQTQREEIDGSSTSKTFGDRNPVGAFLNGSFEELGDAMGSRTPTNSRPVTIWGLDAGTELEIAVNYSFEWER
ncbi:MAG: hypothetical protein SWY16_25210 [Cyanobacteriota bacterium]|nr:hypothetical protein [Cyanobacteriota bacterium]